MKCDEIPLPGGVAIVCSRGRRKSCSVCKTNAAVRQCDYPLTGKSAGKTCDRDLCAGCATKIGTHPKGSQFAGDSLDYCPAHARHHRLVERSRLEGGVILHVYRDHLIRIGAMCDVKLEGSVSAVTESIAEREDWASSVPGLAICVDCAAAGRRR